EGNVLANDATGADSVGQTVAFADTKGQYGTLTYKTDGTWSYTLDNSLPAVQALKAGETVTEAFNYTLTDADGDQSPATLTVTITGTNNAPVALPSYQLVGTEDTALAITWDNFGIDDPDESLELG